jgi:hypothetical protein
MDLFPKFTPSRREMGGMVTFDHTSHLQFRPHLGAVGLPRRDDV